MLKYLLIISIVFYSNTLYALTIAADCIQLTTKPNAPLNLLIQVTSYHSVSDKLITIEGALRTKSGLEKYKFIRNFPLFDNNANKEFYCSIEIPVEPGEYTIDIIAYPESGKNPGNYTLSFTKKQNNKKLKADDIIFYESGTNVPIVSGIVNEGSDYLKYVTFLKSDIKSYYSVKSVLYRKDSGKNQPVSLKYTSIQQHIAYKSFENKRIELTGFFDLQSCKSGKYLVELYFYKEDTIAAIIGKSFRIQWSGIMALKNNPDSVYTLMNGILTNQQAEYYKLIEEKSDRFSYLKNYWEQYNNIGEEYEWRSFEDFLINDYKQELKNPLSRNNIPYLYFPENNYMVLKNKKPQEYINPESKESLYVHLSEKGNRSLRESSIFELLLAF